MEPAAPCAAIGDRHEINFARPSHDCVACNDVFGRYRRFMQRYDQVIKGGLMYEASVSGQKFCTNDEARSKGLFEAL